MQPSSYTQPNVKRPVAICVAVTTIIAAITCLNMYSLYGVSMLSLGISVLGILVALAYGRRMTDNTLRWKVALDTLLISIPIYVAFATYASMNEESGLLMWALTFMFFVFMPLAFFTGYLMSFLLLPKPRKIKRI